MTNEFEKLIRTCFALSILAPASAICAEGELAANAHAAGSTSIAAVRVERIVVRPEIQEAARPEDRWVRFERALGTKRGSSLRHQVTAWRNNDGTRVECYSPCVLNCCAESGGPSPFFGAGFGSK